MGWRFWIVDRLTGERIHEVPPLGMYPDWLKPRTCLLKWGR